MRIKRFVGFSALLFLGLSSSAWGAFCPPGSDPLPPGQGPHTVACTTDAGANLCWQIPAGACKDDNTVTVKVDGNVISQVTYQGTGSSECNFTGGGLISHFFSVGTHTVEVGTLISGGSPHSETFSVTVTPGPVCDTDDDGILNTADNCPEDPNSDQLDTDNDGDGDACDPDDDGDGCDDASDSDPKKAFSVIGSRLAVNCSPPSQPIYGSDGVDTDSDGLLNCQDTDDDNDNIPDADDHCPVIDQTQWKFPRLACQGRPVSCPLQRWWDVCLLGGCNEFLIRLVSLINPDPTAVIFDRFEILNRKLIIFPNAGQSLDDVEALLLGERAVKTETILKNTSARLRLEVWSKGKRGEPLRIAMQFAEYDPAKVRRMSATGRNAVVLTIGEDRSLVAIQRTTR